MLDVHKLDIRHYFNAVHYLEASLFSCITDESGQIRRLRRKIKSQWHNGTFHPMFMECSCQAYLLGLSIVVEWLLNGAG
jgi:hypothetical protein